MILDPDVIRLFGILAASGISPLHMQTVEQARAFYSDKTSKFGGAAAPMAQVREFRAAGPASAIPLRLYQPEGVGDSAPALVYVHGGGWVIGGFASHDKVCRAIAAQTPCSVVAIDYRLAPEHPFPAGFDDVVAASEWIAANNDTLGIDQKRIAIGGDSAGGSMSAAACLHAQASGLKLCAQVLIYPSTDSTPNVTLWPSRVQNAGVPPLTTESLRWFSKKYLPQGDVNLRDWRLSPLHAESLAGLPPAYVITAGFDPLRDEGKAYAERLRSSGVETIYRDFPGQIHGFIEYGGVLGAAGEAIREIAGFLRTQFS